MGTPGPAKSNMTFVIRQGTQSCIAVTGGSGSICHAGAQKASLKPTNTTDAVLANMGVINTDAEITPVIIPSVSQPHIDAICDDFTGVDGLDFG